MIFLGKNVWDERGVNVNINLSINKSIIFPDVPNIL